MVVCQRPKTNHFFSPISKLFLCYLYLLSASPHFIPLIWDSSFGFLGASWLLCDPLWLAPRRSGGRDVLAIYAGWNFHVPDRATNVEQIKTQLFRLFIVVSDLFLLFPLSCSFSGFSYFP